MADSWLFAKGPSSVRLKRTGILSLAVCGPGRVRRFLSFPTNSELFSYVRDIERALASAGFRFRGFAADRRKRAERRGWLRPTDRRSPAP